MKRILSVILILVLLVGLTGSNLAIGDFGISANATESARPSVVDLTSRDDYGWGINVHSSTWAAYPEAYLENHIHLVAKFGADWIRINGGIPSDNNWTYLDTVVGLANKYGLKVIMVFGPSTTLGLDYITLSCEVLATRYNGEDGRGFVDIFQIWNETDLPLMRAKYGGSGADGNVPEHYYTIPVEGVPDLPEYLEYFKAAKKGLENAGGKSKMMINFAGRHWGCALYYLRNGLDIDVLGWDQYVQSPYDLEKSAEDMRKDNEDFYNQVIKEYDIPVIVAETNVHMGRVNQADRENPTLATYEGLMDLLYIFYEQPWIHGAIFYELLDEPAHGMTNQEAWFGLVKCGNGGKIGEPKAIYRELQRLLKGDDNLTMIKREEVNLKPYEKLVVDTADDSELDKENNNSSDIKIEDLPSFDFDTDDETEDLTDEIVSDTVVDTVSDSSDESDVEEVIIENVVNPVKTIKTKEVTHKIPWGLGVAVGGGMLIVATGFVATYILLKKKKLKNK